MRIFIKQDVRVDDLNRVLHGRVCYFLMTNNCTKKYRDSMW